MGGDLETTNRHLFLYKPSSPHNKVLRNNERGMTPFIYLDRKIRQGYGSL